MGQLPQVPVILLAAHPHTLHFRKPAATSRGALTERALWLIEATDTESSAQGVGETGVVPGLSIDDLPDLGERIAAFVERFNAQQFHLTPGPSPEERGVLTPLSSGEGPGVRSLFSSSDEQAVFAPLFSGEGRGGFAPLSFGEGRGGFAPLSFGEGPGVRLLLPFARELAAQPALRFGVESALLDLAQGGTGILFPSDFTEGERGLPTHGLIWMDSPAGVLEQVHAKVRAGFGVIKLKIGALPWEDELAILRTVRTDFPEVELRLDANRAFPVEGIAARLDALARFDVAYLEEPAHFDSLEDYAALIAHAPIPICLDETLLGAVATQAVPALLEQLRPQHVVLKPSLLGGWAATQHLIDQCQRIGIEWWLNSLLESAVGHNAICQFAAATRDGRVHGLGTGSLFDDNFPSPISLRENALWWRGYAKDA